MSLRTARDFLRDGAGSIAITFSAGLVAVCVAVFSAINYGSLVTTRTKMQSAADSAALALASGYVTSNIEKAGQNFFASGYEAEGAVAPMIAVAFDKTANTWKVTATQTVQNALINMFGTTQVSVVSISTASPPSKLSTLTFTPGSAKGWFDKTVTLYAVFANDPSPKALWNMTYKYDSVANTGDVQMTSAKAIDVTNATQIYLQMDIDPSSHGFDLYGSYQTNRTDQTDLINYIRQDGVVLSGPLDLFKAAGCGESKSYNWEDGGDFDYLDFWFTATGECSTETAATDARLIQ